MRCWSMFVILDNMFDLYDCVARVFLLTSACLLRCTYRSTKTSSSHNILCGLVARACQRLDVNDAALIVLTLHALSNKFQTQLPLLPYLLLHSDTEWTLQSHSNSPANSAGTSIMASPASASAGTSRQTQPFLLRFLSGCLQEYVAPSAAVQFIDPSSCVSRTRVSLSSTIKGPKPTRVMVAGASLSAVDRSTFSIEDFTRELIHSWQATGVIAMPLSRVPGSLAPLCITVRQLVKSKMLRDASATFQTGKSDLLCVFKSCPMVKMIDHFEWTAWRLCRILRMLYILLCASHLILMNITCRLLTHTEYCASGGSSQAPTPTPFLPSVWRRIVVSSSQFAAGSMMLCDVHNIVFQAFHGLAQSNATRC